MKPGARKLNPMLKFVLLFLLAMTPPMSQAVEEPPYDVVRQIGDPIELRRYSAYAVARATLDTSAADAGSAAFPLLAGGMRVQLVLPKEVTLATAPEPLDPRVRLRDVPPAQRAVIRYTGSWSHANYDEHRGKLQAVLAAAGIATQGEPVLARYKGAMRPWFMRRNEIWLALR